MSREQLDAIRVTEATYEEVDALITAARRALELEVEITEAKSESDKYHCAMEMWNRTAERRWQKLQAIMQIIGTQGDPEVEVSAVMTDLERANNENAALQEDRARLADALEVAVVALAALREDKARLDWLLEDVADKRERIGAWLWDIATLLCPVDYGEANETQKWGRAAIDAARKGGKR